MRVTKKQLQAIVDRINIITKSPMTTYTKDKKGKFKANIGNFHLDFAYGGCALHRIENAGGGVNTITSGYVTKKELAFLMWQYIAGIEVGRENN